MHYLFIYGATIENTLFEDGDDAYFCNPFFFEIQDQTRGNNTPKFWTKSFLTVLEVGMGWGPQSPIFIHIPAREYDHISIFVPNRKMRFFFTNQKSMQQQNRATMQQQHDVNNNYVVIKWFFLLDDG